MSQLKVNSIIPITGIPSSGGNVYGGGIIQIVQQQTNTQVRMTATTFTDIGLSATITPTSSSSKILVTYDVQSRVFIDANDNAGNLQIVRGSTTISPPTQTYQYGYGARSQYANMASISYIIMRSILDSPNTTSATTYKIQGLCRDNTNNNSVDFQDDGHFFSFLTLMEVSG
tara:strand:- start:520 stop:1035 length:516 start_codon:yes stop_codon:yes gene_type:complete